MTATYRVRTTISIHTLRVEGDMIRGDTTIRAWRFLSTPSVWRVTTSQSSTLGFHLISIHTLRVEGDVARLSVQADVTISIHTLRVEGDWLTAHPLSTLGQFLSTPSVWRVTLDSFSGQQP